MSAQKMVPPDAKGAFTSLSAWVQGDVQAPEMTIVDRPKSPREHAARALCRLSGNPEDVMFERRPMWMSFLEEVDVVLQMALSENAWRRLLAHDEEMAPAQSDTPEEFLNFADLAIHRAKATGRGRAETFMPALGDVAIARRAFVQELECAFKRDEFELFYQPQVNAQSGKLVGAEALIRWNHPQRGLLAPADFLDVLSESTLANSVGEWVLRTASARLAQWRAWGLDIRMGVNLFAAQFRTGRLLKTVSAALSDNALPPDALELEIVETILLRNDVTTRRLLQDIRGLGVRLALDDYGTGFASLSVLKRYPVTSLKIDRSFIVNIDKDPENAAVVNAIIYLAKSFGLDVIAEGVETVSQMDFIKDHGCGEAQGYLFGKPVAASAFECRYLRPGSAIVDACLLPV
jgi:EAL domain-containing protein (putative c-di-GMP-specific phosphodiesterase class I)